jgi:hypothetical protein
MKKNKNRNEKEDPHFNLLKIDFNKDIPDDLEAY